MDETKFCKYCGEKIPIEAVICTKCGRQVEKMEQVGGAAPIVINNSASSSVVAAVGSSSKPLNKWVAFTLCLFLGYLGAHKFYEGKIGRGVLYLFTFGFFGIGWLVDTIILLFRSNPYYV